MKPEVKERRESERVFFTLEEHIGVSVNLTGKDKTIPATLLSISTGGISIAVPKKQKKEIKEGDVLVISGLHLPGLHEAIARIEAEVKHILFYKDYDRMSLGCGFKEISDPVRVTIETFINERIEFETMQGNAQGFDV
ncbi:MAG: PilZ domain-containing protein [Candidatus Aminicenantes bacterium]|nr:MAG: PilZ domain-containing protein [Candidatus Aminicenantes bacterium]